MVLILVKDVLQSQLALCLLVAVSSVKVDRANEGYARGMFADCPGSEKNITIPPHVLRQLSLVVYRYRSSGAPYRRKYSYTEAAAGVASDPRIKLSRPTVIYVSGLFDSANFLISDLFAGVYSRKGYNVLLLDTVRFTTHIYPKAARLSKPVGEKTGHLLAHLVKYGFDPDSIELVGLSLGAHTVAFAAKEFFRLTGMKISRLTALDPAGPCFRMRSENDRLDITDAKFVEVVHTNIDGFGMPTPVGHLNFYVNGGEFQPSMVELFPCLVMCSHIRSFFVWLSAMENPESFIAIRCDSIQQARDRACFDRHPMETNLLGPFTNKSLTGIFYLGTTNKYPYYMKLDGLRKENEVFLSHLVSYNKDNIV